MVAQGKPKFTHEIIDDQPIGSHHSLCLVADIDGDGFKDVVIGNYVLDGAYEGTMVWYEYPRWKRHVIAKANLEAGGVVFDVNGDGRPDIVAGEPYYGNNLFWFENPDDPTSLWRRHVIENRFKKYHDQTVGDVDGDGKGELLISSQIGQVLVYYDIPPDPTVSPWPEEFCHIICKDISVEGLVVVDIDGDLEDEVIAGPNVFKRKDDGVWVQKVLPAFHARTYGGFVFSETRVQVADVNGDGAPDLIMSEGESDFGRLAWFENPSWDMHPIRDGLFHPHSLGIADFNGDWHIDIFVGEMGLGRNLHPKLLIYLNEGKGSFSEVLVDEGHPTHEAKLVDFEDEGVMDIVGKPFYPPPRVDLWKNMVRHESPH